MVLITRPVEQSKSLFDLFKLNNIECSIFPTITITKLKKQIFKDFEIVIFISVNAVKYGVYALENIDRSGYLLLAVGKKTNDELLKFGFKSDYYPAQNPSSKSLLNLPKVKEIKDKKCLIVRGLGGSNTLKNELSKQNNSIEYLEVYQRTISIPSYKYKKVFDQFLSNNNKIIIISSCDILDGLMELTSKLAYSKVEVIKKSKIITLSQRIQQYAAKFSFENIVVAKDIDDNSILQKVIDIST